MSELKKFLDYPASPYVLFNPPTCYECDSLVEFAGRRCDKCTRKFQEELEYAMGEGSKPPHKRLAPKPIDAGFYYVMTCVVIVMIAVYSYLIWCIL